MEEKDLEKELRENFYNREKERKEKFKNELDLEPLFNWLREVTGIKELKFEIEITKDSVEFCSQNISDKSGVASLMLKELYINNFSSAVTSTAPRYYDDEEIDYTKDYDIYYYTSIHFSYSHYMGGSNGHDFGKATYKDGKWEFKLDKDRDKDYI